jgi:hypothetical protein
VPGSAVTRGVPRPVTWISSPHPRPAPAHWVNGTAGGPGVAGPAPGRGLVAKSMAIVVACAGRGVAWKSGTRA